MSMLTQLLELYRDRIPGGSDLVCYWFEKARAMLQQGKVKRVGLLATQGIRGGANRQVLDRIKNTGDIFMAWSDREWVQDDTLVHVSMIGLIQEKKITNRLTGRQWSP